MQIEKFGSSEPIVEAEIFGKKTDFAADFDGRKWLTEDLRVAASGFHESQKHFDGSALARAVRSKETEDFAATHLEGEAADGDLAPENFAKIYRFNGQGRRRQRLLQIIAASWPIVTRSWNRL